MIDFLSCLRGVEAQTSVHILVCCYLVMCCVRVEFCEGLGIFIFNKIVVDMERGALPIYKEEFRDIVNSKIR